MLEERLPIRQPSLATQVVNILVEKIRSGFYTSDSLLPTENQLAAEFQVSRATIRSAMDRLEAQGLIFRRQGIGTFIRRSTIISNPLNNFINFYDLIRDNGSAPGLVQLEARMTQAEAQIAANLQLETDSSVLEIQKVFLADGDPIIYCINYIPEWVFSGFFSPEEMMEPNRIEPTFISFFAEKCHQPFKHFISDVQADLIATASLPAQFSHLSANTPLLVISEIGYNENDQPILQSIEYHPGNRMKFKLIRSPY